jgi:hypothetical protein
MPKIIAFLIALTMCGCASHEDMLLYYDAVKSSTEAHDRTVRDSDIAYIAAVQSMKDNPMAVMALALTYKGGEKAVDYSGIYHPEGFTDYLNAATPLINTGLMWGIGAWGLSEIFGGAGAVYNVSGNGRMAVESSLRESQNGYYGDTALLGTPTGNSSDISRPGYSQCVAFPPAGYTDSGKAQYSPGCSCDTHFNKGGC